MIVAGVWIALLGIAFAVVSLVFLAFHLEERLLLRRLRSAPRVDCGELRSGGRRRNRFVVVTGMTAPGPAGLLQSVAYDTQCVWFATDVVSFDGVNVPIDNTGTARRNTLFRRTAGAPIGLTDQTGTVLLNLKLMLSETGLSTIVRSQTEESALSRSRAKNTIWQGMGRLEDAGLLPASAYGVVMARHCHLREQVVRPGQHISVLARPRRDRAGRVILGRPGGISTEAPDAWIETLLVSSASHARMFIMLPIGLAIAAVGAAMIAVGV